MVLSVDRNSCSMKVILVPFNDVGTGEVDRDNTLVVVSEYDVLCLSRLIRYK